MEDKYAAQTNFLSAPSVSYFYQQIHQQGYIGDNLTQQIIEEPTPEPEPEPTRQIEIEPEVRY